MQLTNDNETTNKKKMKTVGRRCGLKYLIEYEVLNLLILHDISASF